MNGQKLLALLSFIAVAAAVTTSNTNAGMHSSPLLPPLPIQMLNPTGFTPLPATPTPVPVVKPTPTHLVD